MAQKIRALFAAHANGVETAHKIAAQYQAAHAENVEILQGGILTLAEANDLARNQKVSHLLYFHDTEQITMVLLESEMGEFSVKVCVSDLQLPTEK